MSDQEQKISVPVTPRGRIMLMRAFIEEGIRLSGITLLDVHQALSELHTVGGGGHTRMPHDQGLKLDNLRALLRLLEMAINYLERTDNEIFTQQERK